VKLHIGGKERSEGWTVLDVAPAPHVDIVADCADLSMLPDNSCDAIYASHVIEHLDYQVRLRSALKEFFRVLKPRQRLFLSVPDMAILCGLFIKPGLTVDQQFLLIRIMFGGQQDAHDAHMVGFNADLLGAFLREAGFDDIRRHFQPFGLFDDSSATTIDGEFISLNASAAKP
jgi:predicted SAM-dependent methyltransferase